MGFWIVVAVVAIIGYVILMIVREAQRRKACEHSFSCVNDFAPTQQLTGCDGKSGLAVDEYQEKICLMKSLMGEHFPVVVSYADIVSVEIHEDGQSVTKTVRSSQVMGALVGGAIAGGAGFIVGGLSGKTRSDDKVKRIDLRLVVDNTGDPLHFVTLLNLEVKRGGILYEQAMNKALHWKGVIDIAIRRADRDYQERLATLAPEPAPLPSSVADELKKLAELRDASVLSAHEFENAKLRLLGANGILPGSSTGAAI